MTVGIAYQIINDVHHVIAIGISSQNEQMCIRVMIGGVNFDILHIDRTKRFRGNQTACADRLSLIRLFFIENLRDMETTRDFARQKLGVYFLRRTVFVKPKFPIAANPLL